MATIHSGDATIHYEVFGTGYPMLLIAPGGLDSSISMWERATINPIKVFAEKFQLIAMDQRNAGESFGPFPPTNPWDVYCSDQLALMDSLEFTRFHVFGCCIGSSYALRLAHAAPDRVSAAVLEQPMGLVPENQQGWQDRCRTWALQLATRRDDLASASALDFIDRMWSNDFVASLTREEVSEIEVPLCVLPGIDEIHPERIGREIGVLARRSITIAPWKEAPELAGSAAVRIGEFLAAYATYPD